MAKDEYQQEELFKQQENTLNILRHEIQHLSMQVKALQDIVNKTSITRNSIGQFVPNTLGIKTIGQILKKD